MDMWLSRTTKQSGGIYWLSSLKPTQGFGDWYYPADCVDLFIKDEQAIKLLLQINMSLSLGQAVCLNTKEFLLIEFAESVLAMN